MSFVVETSLQAQRAISSCTPAQRSFFEQVRSILAENPYQFIEVIHPNVDSRGRRFYQYYDGLIPLVFIYRVYPPEVDWEPGAPGYVYISLATPAWW